VAYNAAAVFFKYKYRFELLGLGAFLTLSFEGSKALGILFSAVNEAGYKACPETIVDIHNYDIGSATVQHCEQRGKPAK
jgi:hypothetical protein